ATFTWTIGTVGDGEPLPLDGFTDEPVITSGLAQPMSIAFLPDGRMLVIEKDGTIWIADPVTGNTSEYMALTNINSGNERGLLDITLDPEFTSNGYFYLYYTPSSPQRARIARFTHEPNAGG